MDSRIRTPFYIIFFNPDYLAARSAAINKKVSLFTNIWLQRKTTANNQIQFDWQKQRSTFSDL